SRFEPDEPTWCSSTRRPHSSYLSAPLVAGLIFAGFPGPCIPLFPQLWLWVEVILNSSILGFYLAQGERTGEYSRYWGSGLHRQRLFRSLDIARHVRHRARQLA